MIEREREAERIAPTQSEPLGPPPNPLCNSGADQAKSEGDNRSRAEGDIVSGDWSVESRIDVPGRCGVTTAEIADEPDYVRSLAPRVWFVCGRP